MTLRHVVSWRMSGDDAAERAEKARTIRDRLLALEPVVDEILELEVGVNEAGGDDFDIVLIADFVDEDALQRYQVHPEHEKVAALIRASAAGRACVDFTT